MGEKLNREEFLQVANSRKGRYNHDYDYDEYDNDDLLVSYIFSGAQIRERPPDGPEKHGGDNLIFPKDLFSLYLFKIR